MPESKETLRNQLRARREALRTQEIAGLSERIAHNTLKAIDWASIASLHVYQPIPTLREIDTAPFLCALRQRYPSLQTATWQKAAGSYVAFWIDAAGFRAPVPAGHQFDAIVVPLLGFNDGKHRIGWGGGFYDRFLATQPNAVTIGLCYEFGRTTFDPETHDIALKHIVTEAQIKSSTKPR